MVRYNFSFILINPCKIDPNQAIFYHTLVLKQDFLSMNSKNPTRYICYCTIYGCSSTTLGYRSLTKTALRNHTIGQELSRRTFTNFEVVLQRISDELLCHIESGLIGMKSVLRKGAFESKSPKTLCDLLEPLQSTNLPLLKYENWHKESMEFLTGTAVVHPGAIEHSKTVMEKLIAFHESVVESILQTEKLETIDESSIDLSITLSVLPSVEGEIAYGLVQFHFPERLEFHEHDPMTIQDSVSELQESHEPSLLVIRHLTWLNGISERLHSDKELGISSHRKSELIAGLGEHLSNIIARVKTAALITSGYRRSIITVYRSKYIFSLP
jgi:hypothetical protein